MSTTYNLQSVGEESSLKDKDRPYAKANFSAQEQLSFIGAMGWIHLLNVLCRELHLKAEARALTSLLPALFASTAIGSYPATGFGVAFIAPCKKGNLLDP